MRLLRPNQYLEACGAILRVVGTRMGNSDIASIRKKYRDTPEVTEMADAAEEMERLAKPLVPEGPVYDEIISEEGPCFLYFMIAYLNPETGAGPQDMLKEFQKDSGMTMVKSLLKEEQEDQLGEDSVSPAARILRSSLTGEEKSTVLTFLLDEAVVQQFVSVLEQVAEAIIPVLEKSAALYESADRFFREEDAGRVLEERLRVSCEECRDCIPCLASFNGAAMYVIEKEVSALWVGLLFFVIKAFDVGPLDLQQTGERLKLLGDPTKLKILNILSKAPSYQTELARQLSLSVPTVNHHLNALLQKGMVQAQADLESKRVWYSIHPETVRNVLEETKRHLNL